MPRVLDGAKPKAKDEEAAAKHESERQALTRATREQSVHDEYRAHKKDKGRH